jgi:ankyrin repeat protein
MNERRTLPRQTTTHADVPDISCPDYIMNLKRLHLRIKYTTNEYLVTEHGNVLSPQWAFHNQSYSIVRILIRESESNDLGCEFMTL